MLKFTVRFRFVDVPEHSSWTHIEAASLAAAKRAFYRTYRNSAAGVSFSLVRPAVSAFDAALGRF